MLLGVVGLEVVGPKLWRRAATLPVHFNIIRNANRGLVPVMHRTKPRNAESNLTS